MKETPVGSASKSLEARTGSPEPGA